MTTTSGYVVLRWLEANNCVALLKLRFSCTLDVMWYGRGGGGRLVPTVCTNNRNVTTALMVKQERLLRLI